MAMRRADRLFQIIQCLRRGQLMTARVLAERLEVSERTIYRDIRELIQSGVPIEGEPGLGYVMRRGYDLPPLMFDHDELEALVVGVRMLNSWADPAMARAADQALQKIEMVLPKGLQGAFGKSALFVPGIRPYPVHLISPLRLAIGECRKVELGYRDADGATSERTVRPLALFFWGPSWTVLSWCELRNDFRQFRLDRMRSVHVTETSYQALPHQTLEAFMDNLQCDYGQLPKSRVLPITSPVPKVS